MRTTDALRYVARESRGSRGRLGFFVACLAIGVAAVVAVAGLTAGLESAAGREARQLLAADLVVEGRDALPATAARRLDALGTGRATLKELVTVVAAQGPEPGAPGPSQLVELKAVAGPYPFYGELQLEPDRPLSALLDAGSAVVAPELLSRLGLAPGGTLRIGGAAFEIAGVVRTEPDRIGIGLAMGPRVFVSIAGLARTELERFGSRIEYRTLVRLAGEPGRAELAALAEEIRGWPELAVRHDVRTYAEVQPAVRRALARVDRFLGLVALLSLLLGGLGVAQTTRAWLGGRVEAMAILRALGLRPNEVFLLYFAQALALGVAGSLLGIAGGVAVLALAPALTAELLPQPLTIGLWQPLAYLRGLALGMGTAVLASWAPLLAVRRVPPLRALRRDAEPLPPSRGARLATAAALAAGVAALASVQAASIVHGLAFTAGIAAAAAALALLATATVRLAGRASARLAARAPVWLRQGLGALRRPGADAVGAAVALGLGVLLLAAIARVQAGLTAQLSTALPAGSPSAFLIDIQGGQWAGVRELLAEEGAASVRSAPVVTARIARIDGRPVGELLDATVDRGRRWALSREQRVTYLDELAPDNRILAGGEVLWSDPESPEVSVEEDYARDLALTLGTRLELDVQGVPIELTVTSLRSVDWGTFDLNFFLVAEPSALAAAPQYRVATARLPPGGEQRLQDRLALAHPNVTVLALRQVLEKVGGVLDRLATGVRFLGGFTLVAGLAILAGAVGAGAVRRGREIALLKTLGMVRREIALMFALEFALLGATAGAVGALGGELLAAAVLTRGLELEWTFAPLAPIVTVAATGLIAAAAALAAGTRALAARPLDLLQGG